MLKFESEGEKFKHDTCATPLERYRLDHNLSYRQLAKKLGFDSTSCYRWCWGERHPSYHTAKKIEKLTNAKISRYMWGYS